MAVYKQTYKDYEGKRTAAWSRFLILMRYSYARLFQSRFLVLFLALCFFYPLGCATMIYLSHNSPALAMLRLQADALPAIDGKFFKGKPDEQIAKEKKIPRRKVNYRKHQGLINLRKALSDVAFMWIRPKSAFFRNYYMMASAKQNLSALLGGEEGDCS